VNEKPCLANDERAFSSTACNVLMSGPEGVYTLAAPAGRPRNCSLTTLLFPANFHVLHMKLPLPATTETGDSGRRRRGKDFSQWPLALSTATRDCCALGRPTDFVELGGSEGLHSRLLAVREKLCTCPGAKENDVIWEKVRIIYYVLRSDSYRFVMIREQPCYASPPRFAWCPPAAPRPPCPCWSPPRPPKTTTISILRSIAFSPVPISFNEPKSFLWFQLNSHLFEFITNNYACH